LTIKVKLILLYGKKLVRATEKEEEKEEL